MSRTDPESSASRMLLITAEMSALPWIRLLSPSPTRLVATWQAMPATYATESQGRAAIAHLHYLLGGADW